MIIKCLHALVSRVFFVQLNQFASHNVHVYANEKIQFLHRIFGKSLLAIDSHVMLNAASNSWVTLFLSPPTRIHVIKLYIMLGRTFYSIKLFSRLLCY